VVKELSVEYKKYLKDKQDRIKD